MEVEEYGVFVAVFAGNIALADQACAPAAAVAFVFCTDEHFQRFFGFDFVVVTGNGVQVFTQRPLGGKVDLAEPVVEIVTVGLQIDAFVASVFVARA